MRLSTLVTKFSTEQLLGDLGSASAAGLIAALFTVAGRIWFHQYILLRSVIWYLFIALITYLVVALCLSVIWKGLLRRVVPTWLMIGLLGSIAFVGARLTPGVIAGWYDPLRLEPSLAEYLWIEFSAAKDLLLMYWILTIPAAGLAYYGVSIARMFKRRTLDSEATSQL